MSLVSKSSAIAPTKQGNLMSLPSTLNELVSLLERAGYPRTDVALLHRADVFLELSGEDIRKRLYLTQDADGHEMCLRPEFTIPLCMRAVSSDPEGSIKAALSYCGPVFRHRTGESGEFIQAGVESLGRHDTEAADAEVLALALDVAHLLDSPSAEKPVVRLGDAGLINGVLEALSASPAFARRFKRRLAAGKTTAHGDAPSSGFGLNRYAGVMAALEGTGLAAAKAFVGDMLTMSGVRASGGRTSEEIAARFLSKTEQGNSGLSEEKTRVLHGFLEISGNPDQVAEKVRRFAQANALDIAAPLERYEARLGFMAAKGINLTTIAASAGFVRNLDYYTGMVFEIAASPGSNKPLVGGGRYDGLLKRLGAINTVPAVGFSIWPERFHNRQVSNPSSRDLRMSTHPVSAHPAGVLS
jgi:ATP phosphoribosyltransferase regulatory subunit